MLVEKIQVLCKRENITLARLEKDLNFGNGTIRSGFIVIFLATGCFCKSKFFIWGWGISFATWGYRYFFVQLYYAINSQDMAAPFILSNY